MKLFDTNGKLYGFMNQFKDLLIFNFMWILLSIPIVTIGAASVAACAVGMKMVRDEENYIARMFLKEFKKNWKQGTAAWFLILVLSYGLYLDFQILHAQEEPSILVIIGSVAAVAALFFAFSYTFALIARYENSVVNSIQNSFHLATRYIGKTIVMTVTLAVIMAILLFNQTMLYFMIVIGPGVLFYTYSHFCLLVFEKAEADNPGATQPVKKEKRKKEK